MRIALCNEVIREMEFAAQCEFAAALGYDAVELAPFTLGEAPHMLGAEARRALRRAASDAGIAIASLHWLLVTPDGLSITSAEPDVRARTLEVMRRLVGFCAEVGGSVLVHGSPAQRRIADGEDAARGREAFAAIAEDAEAHGVTYCIEPLAPQATNFINTVAEAAEIVQAIDSPAVRTMIDCCAARQTEALPLDQLIDQWLPRGLIGHVQVNDSNLRGPGQGDDRFAPALAALARHGYDGWVAVEPFVYQPDGPAAAARAIGYLRGIEEALTWAR